MFINDIAQELYSVARGLCLRKHHGAKRDLANTGAYQRVCRPGLFIVGGRNRCAHCHVVFIDAGFRKGFLIRLVGFEVVLVLHLELRRVFHKRVAIGFAGVFHRKAVGIGVQIAGLVFFGRMYGEYLIIAVSDILGTPDVGRSGFRYVFAHVNAHACGCAERTADQKRAGNGNCRNAFKKFHADCLPDCIFACV